MAKNKIGIALAGGGARGIAHIGVLQALEENGISPSYVSGASAGSIVGTLYAADLSPAKILSLFKETSLLTLFRSTLPTVGLSDLSSIKDILAKHIPIDSFEALEKRMFISVTNLTKGRSEIASQGPVFDWVVASSSIPIVFTARTLNEEMYVDGGVMNNLPVEPLLMHCDKVIGVNITPIHAVKSPSDLLTIGYRTLDLVSWINVQPQLKLCDIVIEPGADVYGYFEVAKADEIFQLGYEAAMAKMPEILDVLAGKAKTIKPQTYAISSATQAAAPKISPEDFQAGKASFPAKYMWVAAALCLVLGLTGGFWSGYTGTFSWEGFGISLAISIFVGIGALLYFRQRR